MTKSTQERELPFSGTTGSASTTIQQCISTERPKDTRTSAEKAELLAWVRSMSHVPLFSFQPHHLPHRPANAPR